MANKKKNRGWKIVGIGCGCSLFILLILSGLYLYAGWLGYQEEPMFVEPLALSVQLEDSYIPTKPQEEKLFSIGYPEAFTILFYEEEIPGGGIQTVRLETWDYYSLALSLTFLNGELIAEDQLEITGPVDLASLPYYPEQFIAFMDLDQVLSAGGIASYIQIPLEELYMEEGVMYFAEGLSFGLKDNELVYIESFAISQ